MPGRLALKDLFVSEQRCRAAGVPEDDRLVHRDLAAPNQVDQACHRLASINRVEQDPLLPSAQHEPYGFDHPLGRLPVCVAPTYSVKLDANARRQCLPQLVAVQFAKASDSRASLATSGSRSAAVPEIEMLHDFCGMRRLDQPGDGCLASRCGTAGPAASDRSGLNTRGLACVSSSCAATA